jgi:imidazole glycerol phosphate synthase subunit HisF
LLLSVTQACNVPVIASGGGRTARHMAEAFLMGGADAVLAASIFHDDLSEKPEDSSLARIKQELRKHGLFPREAFPEPASPLSRLTKPELSATYEPRP